MRCDDLSYFCWLVDAATFTTAGAGEIQRRGVETAGRVAGVVDGDDWCQRFLGPDAVRIPDFSHAAQRTELRDGAAITVLVAIHTLPLPTGSDTGTPARVQAEVLGYLEPRVAQMRYAAVRAQGLPIGSGLVESANKLVVEDRMKRAGRRWAARHVTPLVAIRGALCSGRWDEAWAAITQARSPRARRCPVASPPAPVASSAKR